MSGAATSPHQPSLELNSALLPAPPSDYKVHPPLSALLPFLRVRSIASPHRWRSQDLQPRSASVAASLPPAQSAARWSQTHALQDMRASSSLNFPRRATAWLLAVRRQRAPAACFPPATLPIAGSQQNSLLLRGRPGLTRWLKRGPACSDHALPVPARRCIPPGSLPGFPALEYPDRWSARPAEASQPAEASTVRSAPARAHRRKAVPQAG